MDASLGSICMTPGFGYGGPCYPRDIKALAKYSELVGVVPYILCGVQDTNQQHHVAMVQKYIKQGLDVYIFENVFYRPDMSVPLIDNSPTLKVASDLAVIYAKRVVIRGTVECCDVVRNSYGPAFEYQVIE